MAHNERWKQDDDDVVLEEVEKSPTNINSACRRAAIKLDRTPRACRARWDEYLKKHYSVIYTSTSNGTVVNYKNTAVGGDGGFPDDGSTTMSELPHDGRVQVLKNRMKGYINTNSNE